MTESAPRHRELAAGKWAELSLAEQLGNVGSEVGRMRRWTGRDERLCDAASGGREYRTTLADLDRYFLAFAVAARARREAKISTEVSP